MSGLTPDHRVRVPLSAQVWDRVTFLHYRAGADDLDRLLPDGLEPDTCDGSAWVSFTPLIMREVRPTVLPPVPGWSTFVELNIRTYVRDHAGRDGLWFFALDCPRHVMVWGLRPLGLPYRHRPGSFRVEETRPDSESVHYSLGRGVARRDLDVQVGAAIEDQSRLDVFLTGRWNAYTTRFGRLCRVPAAHEPWRLHQADVDGSLLSVPLESRLPLLDEPPLVHFSPGVHARLGAPRLA
ncbi:DUF2071 domain-containing protein [Brevibacterium sp.]|uniref:YqjF family protein n=1 Tax=Brevibacterium sp. TaxID=1701 RepID=UPI002810F994|nr:DUF2071 domain-containing protein [Brevibacterium sp.]